jgi:hypothetical protein
MLRSVVVGAWIVGSIVLVGCDDEIVDDAIPVKDASADQAADAAKEGGSKVDGARDEDGASSHGGDGAAGATDAAVSDAAAHDAAANDTAPIDAAANDVADHANPSDDATPARTMARRNSGRVRGMLAAPTSAS